MPVSKNRKGHDKKAAYRKQMIEAQKRRQDEMFKEMFAQLQDKNRSMTELLNKEEIPNYDSMPPVSASSQSIVLSPEEQKEQDAIQASAIITTN
jgi:ribosomal protein L16 Arg81 hydroxylase